jgi:geranylgeranyl pyrophosphate synthase
MSIWDILKVEIEEKWKKYWLDTHPKEIGEYSWDYLFTGGKQIRPKLFCELWHYLSPDSKIIAELAFAIECIHVSSIILDDTPWMDNASERRGKKTIHTVFSPKKAVLVSYDLIDMAINIWKNNRPSHINSDTWITLLKSKLQRLMIGQWYDLEKTGSLIELSSLKTGVLFELVTETVAVCTNLDPEFWKIWGNNLGVLFQWMDDFLDMDEDKQQNNRNAFNESYENTLQNYFILWQSIEKGIGKQWFENSFGQYMKNYFTQKINISEIQSTYDNLSSIQLEYPTNILIPELIGSSKLDKKYYFNFINGKQMIKYIWNNVDNMISQQAKHNFWNIDESQWENDFPNI